MTDTLHSPRHKFPTAMSRKRGNCENEDEMVDIPIVQFNKRIRGDQSASFEERPCENTSPQLGLNVFSLADSQRKRGDFSDALAMQQQIELISKVYQAQIDSLKAQFQSQIESKNRELAHLMTLNNKLVEEYKKSSQENNTALEENKILKRAVQIQDGRQKELTEQCSQYQHIIQAAADHIKQLEETNRSLLNELQHGCGRGFPPHHRPPDVF